MRIPTLLFVFATLLSSTCFAEIYIKPIFESRSNELIKVGSKWRSDCPKRIKVSLAVDTDTPSKDITVKAYFFDSSNSEVATYNSFSQIWKNTSQGFDGVGLPKTLQKNKNFDIFFPITPEMEKKWKSVVIVCSDPQKTVARSRPAAVVKEISFPGKESAVLIEN